MTRAAAMLAWSVPLVLALFVSVFCAQGARAEIGAYLLFDMKSGAVIARHRASTPWYPASITKLMTAYVTFEAIEAEQVSMSSPVTISPQARQQPPSKMGFPLGTVITVETALRIILTKSANDVSVALAEAIGGTQAQFIDKMNGAAQKLGMRSSSFDNPHGLPNSKQITTARDVALLMRALDRDFARHAEFFEMSGVRLGGRLLRNHNALIRRFRGTDGMKTGFICASGFNIAATATRGEVRLGVVVLGGLTSRERNERTAELLAKGFDAVKSGGTVALDGFGDLDAKLVHAPVEGTRQDIGAVEDLPHSSADVVDLRSTVCGSKRPRTRYSDGVFASKEAFDERRLKAAMWDEAAARRKTKLRAVLSAPRPEQTAVKKASEPKKDITATASTPPRPIGPLRQFGDDSLKPVAWTASATTIGPLVHPRRSVAAVSSAPTSWLAPDGWTPSPRRPIPNPLEAADLRGPLPEPPIRLPLSYMETAVAKAPINISIGGADPSRPSPLSGAIVGGGPAPKPAPKPLPATTEMAGEEAATPVDS
ncbi:MAG: D-alanyl-D-alanine carboxypeptidase family protein [Pseudomonadota bacterium]